MKYLFQKCDFFSGIVGLHWSERWMLGAKANLLQILGDEPSTCLFLSYKHIQCCLGASASGLHSPAQAASSGDTLIFTTSLPCVATPKERRPWRVMCRASWPGRGITTSLPPSSHWPNSRLDPKQTARQTEKHRLLHGQQEGDGAGSPFQRACTPWPT